MSESTLLVPELLDRIRAEIVEHRFHMADTSFGALAIDDEVKEAVAEGKDDDVCAGLLYFFPDFFVYPRDIPPERGCFLGVVIPEGEQVHASRDAVLRAHFPCDKVALFTEAAGQIRCRWYEAPTGAGVPIRAFLAALATL